MSKMNRALKKMDKAFKKLNDSDLITEHKRALAIYQNGSYHVKPLLDMIEKEIKKRKIVGYDI